MAPDRRYNPLRSHFNWRYLWDYASGDFMDFWCHIADVAYWALDLQAPERVSAVGGRHVKDDATETPDALDAQFAFPGLNFSFRLRPTPMPGFEHMGGIGCIFEGTRGTLVTSYGEHEVYVDGKRWTTCRTLRCIFPTRPDTCGRSWTGVKSRNMDTACNVRYGHKLTKAGLLANIACRTGTTVEWDDENEEIVPNTEDSRLLRLPFRDPWIL